MAMARMRAALASVFGEYAEEAAGGAAGGEGEAGNGGDESVRALAEAPTRGSPPSYRPAVPSAVVLAAFEEEMGETRCFASYAPERLMAMLKARDAAAAPPARDPSGGARRGTARGTPQSAGGGVVDGGRSSLPVDGMQVLRELDANGVPDVAPPGYPKPVLAPSQPTAAAHDEGQDDYDDAKAAALAFASAFGDLGAGGDNESSSSDEEEETEGEEEGEEQRQPQDATDTKDATQPSTAAQPPPKQQRHAQSFARFVDERLNSANPPKITTPSDISTNFSTLVPNPVITFPFPLDHFQREAIYCIEKHRHVFVGAHTGSGKTVVAEYAVATCLARNARCIYTSPIKTLSNQKYGEFKAKGFDVGLLTGDLSINPTAQVLIMTTEVLRSLLYRGDASELVRELLWVVFDEVHYVNDVDRGVVWEECIIMLPKDVGMVLLSATVPNALEFADWIGRTKRRMVYVTNTKQRPVPLRHCLYADPKVFEPVCNPPLGTWDGDAFRKFRDGVRAKCGGGGGGDGGGGQAGRPQSGGGRGGGRSQGGGGRSQGSRGGGPPRPQSGRGNSGGGGGKGNLLTQDPRSKWTQLARFLQNHTNAATGEAQPLLPCLVFVFSKKKCDTLADNMMASRVDLLATAKDGAAGASRGDKHAALSFYDSCIHSVLGPADAQLPQVLRCREYIKAGIGVHHAGILPVVREITEMLFCRGLIQLLFCTETFAVGVNAPARCVVFPSLKKHDGTSRRHLLADEYTQMAGRAGRRGLDKEGLVIVACGFEESYRGGGSSGTDPAAGILPAEEGTVRRLLTGRASQLHSQFKLSYGMILSLLRSKSHSIEGVLKMSFNELQTRKVAPKYKMMLREREAALAAAASLPWPGQGGDGEKAIYLAAARSEASVTDAAADACAHAWGAEYASAVTAARGKAAPGSEEDAALGVPWPASGGGFWTHALTPGRVCLLLADPFDHGAPCAVAVYLGDASPPAPSKPLLLGEKPPAPLRLFLELHDADYTDGADTAAAAAAAVAAGALAPPLLGRCGGRAHGEDAFGYAVRAVPSPQCIAAVCKGTVAPAAPSGVTAHEWAPFEALVADPGVRAHFFGAAASAAASTAPAAGLGDAFAGLQVMSKADDDDDDLMLGMGGGGGKKGKKGKKGGGGGGVPSDPLPHASSLSSSATTFSDHVFAVCASLSGCVGSAIGASQAAATQAAAAYLHGESSAEVDFEAAFGKTAWHDYAYDATNALCAADPLTDGSTSELDAVQQFRKHAHAVAGYVALRQAALSDLAADTLLVHPSKRVCFAYANGIVHVQRGIQRLQFQLSANALQMMPEFHRRRDVLEHLGYFDPSMGVVTLKGRCCVEIATGNELLMTEVYFGRLFAPLTPAEVVAICSAFVFQEKTDVDEHALGLHYENERRAAARETAGPAEREALGEVLAADLPTEGLARARATVVSTAMRLGELQRELGVPNMGGEGFVKDVLRFGLVGPVYHWASGVPFVDICRETDVMEGTIVRTVLRLDECLREFQTVANYTGDASMHAVCESARLSIKRDICTSASLYLR